MAKNQELKDRIWKDIEAFNETYGKFEQVKKIALCDDAWAIDSGELTPSLKLKRKFIMNKYSHLVSAIYEG